ncbi:MAG TPA: Crp/Fnr family transcriptional regulator [Hyphomonadaceae bacterium]|nr:Crp/Fnr family transcriptional regulator [Hyphomonadaceae bacterium]
MRNTILAQLPAGDFSVARAQLERVSMAPGDILQGAGEPAKSIFFVESGIISLLAPLEQGGRIEIGHVGREGAAGVHAALGADTLTSEIMAQSDGVALRADAANLRGMAEQSAPLRYALNGFANALHAQVAQVAACNGAHEVVQRLARWLLMVHDRTDGDTLNLTHEVISLMLGVTRPGVTIAAGTLQKSGLIQYSRGRLTIVDRPGLEQAACECYAIVSTYYRSELD